MGKARGHHFISQCYLKRFTRNGSKNSKLWAYEIREGKAFETLPANVAHQRDFNRVDLEGHAPDALETSLAQFESQVEPALKAIEAARSLEDTEAWLHVLNLVTLFAVRNPRMREMMRDAHERTARMVMDLTLAKRERWESQVKRAVAAGHLSPDLGVTYEEAKDFHERGDYTIEVPTTRHIGTEFHMFEPVLQTMADRQWQLCIAGPDSGGFITTDHPVCLMHSEGHAYDLSRPLGYGLPGTSVVFPLTRELLAVGTIGGQSGVLTLTKGQVAYFNTLILGYADRQIYAPHGKWVFAPQGLSEPLVPGADVGRYLRPPPAAKKTAARGQR